MMDGREPHIPSLDRRTAGGGWRVWRLPILVAVTTAFATVALALGAHSLAPRTLHPVEAAIAASWSRPPHRQVWAQQDLTQRDCTSYGNRPPDREAVAIMEREWRAIVYPADGDVFGDWRRGAVLAGGRAPLQSDAPATAGGQCSACHQLGPDAGAGVGPDQQKSGPPLTGYGLRRGSAGAERKLLYEQIFNSNAVIACSIMPRFGAHNVLTPDQIRDIVAYLLAPDSPVNAGVEFVAGSQQAARNSGKP